MPVPVRVDFHFYGELSREGHWWVAHCPPLDVASQGRTPEEAKTNLREAIQLFIESCNARGTLFDALRELGFAPGLHAEPPSGAFPVDIPLAFTSRGARECAA